MKQSLLAVLVLLAAVVWAVPPLQTAAPAPERRPTAELVRNLTLRTLGPNLSSGRIGDIAVDPKNRSTWYVAVASGGVWKTTNRGLSWTPIFDHQGSYSIGCVTVDARNPATVWVGTGENQSQRSAGYGDGVYRSDDGGINWRRVGLEKSEHIGKILIDPRDSGTVYVAAQGPLWSSGGDRGLYKTSDGGKTWKAVLQISPDTGVTDIALEPGNPDVIYAAAYQRRRHVGVLVGGGPEAGIYRSDDGGNKWTRLTKGLPEGDLGRISLAVSPQKPEVVYAHVTATRKVGNAFYRSTDRGATWVRQGNYSVQDPQYYGEIYADPFRFDRVWVMDMRIAVTDDGGKKFRPQNWPIHVDNHAIAFDPGDENHLLVGNDGGLYETYDGGKTWRHFNNLSVTQFYRCCVDEAYPFYNVYGGTQDNGTQAGPARSRVRAGVRASEWDSVGGGDGMQPRVDPKDPNTAYVMSQYGALQRLDRRTGQRTIIRPRLGGKGTAVRWNWDSPLIISPHSNTRLYFAGSKLFRSDDRGDNWSAGTPDLTRQLDAGKMEVMGRVWGPDVIKTNFTTSPGVASALDESPRVEGLLYYGSDDGLIQVSEDGGKKWQKIDRFANVPAGPWVSDLCASRHDDNVVYATFHHMWRGDFTPYVARSNDRGKTWASISGDLPARHVVWSVKEDHVARDLLFAGTEFGVFFTSDGGKRWVKLNGVPPVAVRDVQIQRRESDLVCATFGRGLYVLDDYGGLRHLTPPILAKEAALFPVRKTYWYHEQSGRATETNPATPNPPFGAILSVYLRDSAATRYVVTVADDQGKVISSLPCPTTAGLHRLSWDLRAGQGVGKGGKGGKGGFRPAAPLVKPGTYRARLGKTVEGKVVPVGDERRFEVVSVEP